MCETLYTFLNTINRSSISKIIYMGYKVIVGLLIKNILPLIPQTHIEIIDFFCGEECY